MLLRNPVAGVGEAGVDFGRGLDRGGDGDAAWRHRGGLGRRRGGGLGGRGIGFGWHAGLLVRRAGCRVAVAGRLGRRERLGAVIGDGIVGQIGGEIGSRVDWPGRIARAQQERGGAGDDEVGWARHALKVGRGSAHANHPYGRGRTETRPGSAANVTFFQHCPETAQAPEIP